MPHHSLTHSRTHPPLTRYHPVVSHRQTSNNIIATEARYSYGHTACNTVGSAESGELQAGEEGVYHDVPADDVGDVSAPGCCCNVCGVLYELYTGPKPSPCAAFAVLPQQAPHSPLKAPPRHHKAKPALHHHPAPAPPHHALQPRPRQLHDLHHAAQPHQLRTHNLAPPRHTHAPHAAPRNTGHAAPRPPLPLRAAVAVAAPRRHPRRRQLPAPDRLRKGRARGRQRRRVWRRARVHGAARGPALVDVEQAGADVPGRHGAVLGL